MFNEFIITLLKNQVFLSVAMAGISCQLTKMIIYVLVHRQKFHIKDIFVTGGMPSTHSALVWALTLSILLSEGPSALFVLSLVILAIVLRDAMGVRRTAGEEGHIIHEIIKKTNLKIKEYHYSMGHTPKQVIVGSLIGIGVALIINSII